LEDINLLNKRDVVTLSTSGGAIVDWSIIGAPARPVPSLRRSTPARPDACRPPPRSAQCSGAALCPPVSQGERSHKDAHAAAQRSNAARPGSSL